MPLTLYKLVESRIKRMSTFIPKGFNSDPLQSTVQGTLFLSSGDTSEISKELVPLIKKNPGKLTELIIDAWLETRASRDFLA